MIPHREPDDHPTRLPRQRRAGLRRAGARGDDGRRRGPGRVAEIDPLRPLGPGPPHFAAKAEELHLPVHGRRAEPHRPVRPQARADEASTASRCRRSFGKVFTPMGVGGNNLLASRRKFAQHGESGLWVSDWYPNIAEVVDDIALVRSCWADGVNHVGSVCQMNTGSILAGRPSLGAWVTYGLGTENQDLPAFVVMTDAAEPIGGPRNWGNAWLPATFQGTPVPQGRRRRSSTSTRRGRVATPSSGPSST